MARDFIQNSEQYLAHIDAEIERLQQLRTQVTGAIQGDKEVAASPAPRKGMSLEGRKRVAEAQKARWAKLKRTNAKKPDTQKAAGKKGAKKVAATKAVAS